jgi:hypothetical protein
VYEPAFVREFKDSFVSQPFKAVTEEEEALVVQ